MAGRFLDYIAQGTYASRPAAAGMPALVVTGAGAVYYAYDTGVFSFFNEDTVAWDELDISVLTGLYSDLSDVDWTTPAADGQVMIYDFGTLTWIPGDFPAIPTTEQIQDLVAAMMVNGTGINTSYNDGTGEITITCTLSQYTDEMVRDVIGAALVQGTGITITVNDGADTITIACTITQYTDGMADARVALATLAGLDDVNTAGLANGDSFKWDAGTSKFIVYTPAGVGGINTLSDVDTATDPPVVGEILEWNGTNWVPGAKRLIWSPDVPVLADFTTLLNGAGIGAPSIAAAPYNPGILSTHPRQTGSGHISNFVGKTNPYGSGSFRVEARLSLANTTNNNYPHTGIAVMVNATGKNFCITNYFDLGSYFNLQTMVHATQVSTVTGVTGVDSGIPGMASGSTYRNLAATDIWLAIDYDTVSGLLESYWSIDGLHWYCWGTYSTASFGTYPDRIGFYHKSVLCDAGNEKIYCSHFHVTDNLSELRGLHRLT